MKSLTSLSKLIVVHEYLRASSELLHENEYEMFFATHLLPCVYELERQISHYNVDDLLEAKQESEEPVMENV